MRREKSVQRVVPDLRNSVNFHSRNFFNPTRADAYAIRARISWICAVKGTDSVVRELDEGRFVGSTYSANDG